MLDAALLSYGGIGVLALAAGVAALRLYRDRERDRDRHSAEKAALIEAHVKKAETWMERYHEMAQSQQRLIESLERRYQRRG